MEKRGYVKAGPWTPEATVEYPEAVKQLHREFLRAGSDVMQAFTYYASEDKLTNRKVYFLYWRSKQDLEVIVMSLLCQTF